MALYLNTNKPLENYKAVDSKEIFDTLNIGKVANYEEHLNKYNVINISFNAISEIGNTYDDYIKMIRDTMKKDIAEMYPIHVQSLRRRILENIQ